MLKYSISLCIILFSVSDERRVGIYRNLVLVLHSPVTSFFWQQINQGNHNIGADEFEKHFYEHGLAITADKWIIHGFWPIDLFGQQLTFCEGISRRRLTYNHGELNQNFQEELKTIWPILRSNETVESLWEKEYNMRGSCVTAYTSFYFTSAVHVFGKYNIGDILSNSRIFPGNNYNLEDISASITNSIGKRIYLKCLPAQNPQEQYLLQVQLCFTPLHDIVNCTHRQQLPPQIHECDRRRIVTYTGIPTDEI